MDYNWTYVKKITLWQYEDLLNKLNTVLAYPLIRQAYNHSMPQAIDFARRLFGVDKISAGEYPASLISVFGCLQVSGVRDWGDFLAKVSTRETCVSFVEQYDLHFEQVIDVLHYLLRWAFPFYMASRELLDHDNPQEMEHYPVLKQHRLMCSFELLEQGRTESDRRSLLAQTHLPLKFLTAIIHRADIARLPYVRRKTILPVCGAGYDTLAKIAGADVAKMEADMITYFQRTRGKTWNDFKSVIVLRGLVTEAKALPKLMHG